MSTLRQCQGLLRDVPGEVPIEDEPRVHGILVGETGMAELGLADQVKARGSIVRDLRFRSER